MKLQSNYVILFKKENLLEREMTKMRYVLNMKQDTFFIFSICMLLKLPVGVNTLKKRKF